MNMLSTLAAIMESAFTRAAITPRGSQSRNPYDFIDAGSGLFDTSGEYNTDQQRDQYAHYRGSFHSAARVIVQRIASQPIYAAKRGVSNHERSLRRMVEKGFIPPSGLPEWLGTPDTMEVLQQHPVLTAFADPNRWLTPFNMWEIGIGGLLVTGRLFIVAMESDRKGRAIDLFPVPSTWMKPIGNYDKWRILPPGESGNGIEVSDSQVCHAYFADPQSLTGAISPLSMVARAVLSDEAIANAQYSDFKNGAMPKVALIAGDVMNETSFTDDPNRTSAARPVRLEPHQRRQIVTWFQQQYAGVQKHGLPIVLDQIIRDIKILSRKPNEMGYIESAQLTKEQIFEELGVSPILTGKLDSATRASGDLADQILVTNCLNPIITLVSQMMTKKFGPLFSVNGEQLSVWIAPALYNDTAHDEELLKLGVRAYALDRNEIREILRRRFGGLPWREDMQNVIMPQTLDTRGEDDEWAGIGRLPFLGEVPATAEPAEPPPEDDSTDEQSTDAENVRRPRFSLNGKH